MRRAKEVFTQFDLSHLTKQTGKTRKKRATNESFPVRFSFYFVEKKYKWIRRANWNFEIVFLKRKEKQKEYFPKILELIANKLFINSKCRMRLPKNFDYKFLCVISIGFVIFGYMFGFVFFPRFLHKMIAGVSNFSFEFWLGLSITSRNFWNPNSSISIKTFFKRVKVRWKV